MIALLCVAAVLAWLALVTVAHGYLCGRWGVYTIYGPYPRYLQSGPLMGRDTIDLGAILLFAPVTMPFMAADRMLSRTWAVLHTHGERHGARHHRTLADIEADRARIEREYQEAVQWLEETA